MLAVVQHVVSISRFLRQQRQPVFSGLLFKCKAAKKIMDYIHHSDDQERNILVFLQPVFQFQPSSLCACLE